MTGINHALTGVSIAVFIDKPILALPLAFLSHFLLDLLPHFGEIFENRRKFSKTVWSIDLLCVLLFLLLLIFQQNWYFLIAAIFAMSPDFAWIYRFTVSEKYGKLPPKPENKFNKFHASIQKLEFRWGIIVEIMYFAVMVFYLSSKL